MRDDLLEISSIAQAWRAEGARKLTRVSLEARFGLLSEEVLQALSTADEATLIAIVTHPTESLEEVCARLGLKGRPDRAERMTRE